MVSTLRSLDVDLGKMTRDYVNFKVNASRSSINDKDISDLAVVHQQIKIGGDCRTSTPIHPPPKFE